MFEKRGEFLFSLVILLTLCLTVALAGDVVAMSSEPVEEEVSDEPAIEAGHQIRVHYQREDENYDDLGLWIWDDVLEESEDLGDWPDGAISFAEEQTTDYGVYVDIELSAGAEEIGFLINDTDGDNLSDNLATDILSADMEELWIQESDGEHEVYLYKPVDLAENTVRVHYLHDEESYEPWGLWTWGEVVEPSENSGDWPDGATDFDDDNIGYAGAYVDIEIEENASQINFLAVNQETQEQTEDMNVANLTNEQLFFRAGDEEVYTNPFYASEVGLENGELLSETMQLRFSTTEGLKEEELSEEIKVKDIEGNQVEVLVAVVVDESTVEVAGYFDTEQAPYTVSHDNVSIEVDPGWRLIDEVYGYDGDLGVELHQDGSATMKLWSPGADNVSIVLYDKDDQFDVVTDDVDMELGDSGVWEVTLDEANTGVDDLRGYYYHYDIERDGSTRLALDPYASSMAAWNNNPDDPEKEYRVGKAAIVDPAEVGPELDFADIDGFEAREDAIIYESHVRDFTSDPEIADELEAEFGTFASFVEKLDYIEELGVTHVQLLPVMSYLWGDELANDERELHYSSSGNNYNWGYDPHSYFSITGMYSEDPEDAELRIKEFKKLIEEIHNRDMGVILDVVYNHTASVHIFEDLVPNYYHFMDADGTSRTSFGGGRLGTTHKMARRILVDSIMYWKEEFKVDGFRFDMMGDHDAESIQKAYDKAKELNPNVVMIGEGWRTFVGDEGEEDVKPADQDWMQHTESVGVFSDDFRDEMKSGFGAEGEPRFLGDKPRDVEHIFDNMRAQPHNFKATHPGDVVPYIEAHDNLTLHDALAIATNNDPDIEENQAELQRRIRLGNAMVLTAQGTSFIHSGQEYGRTKQFRAETDEAPPESYKGRDDDGEPFKYPYFIDDSYDSTDAINRFDWTKATEDEMHTKTVDYTRGLIELRRSTDAFRLKDMDTVESNVNMLESDNIEETDLALAFSAEATDGEIYYVVVNADNQQREIDLDVDLTGGEVIVDAEQSGTEEIANPAGVDIDADGVTLDALTVLVVRGN